MKTLFRITAVAASLALALAGAVSTAVAALPAGMPVGDVIVGTVVSVDVQRTGQGPILTDVAVLTSNGVEHFTMRGGRIGELGMWTEEYRDLAVGESIAAPVAVGAAASAPVVGAPALLSSGTGRAVTDYIYSSMRWDYASLPITWKFNTTNAPAGALAAVQAGPDTWEADAGSNMDFTYGGTTTSLPDVADGVNTVAWAENISGSELAHCMYWYYGATWGSEIVEFDINFNRYYSWSTAPTGSQYDIQTVATHEFGHTLNLGDMYYAGASGQMMYGYTSAAQVKHSLGDGDVAGIHVIYPASAPVDTTAPIVSSNAVSTYSGPASINITASDAGSGVSRIEWRVDSNATTTVMAAQATANASGIGAHTLYYAAYDVAGNVASDSRAFTITDGQPPVTTVSGVPAGWTSVAQVNVGLSAVDFGGSTVAATYYQVGAGPVLTYAGTIPVTAEGTTTIKYRSVDTYSPPNSEVTKTVDVKIDRTKPTASDNAVATYPNSATVRITGADTHSGVASIAYRIDGGAWNTAAGTVKDVLVNTLGAHTITYHAIDAAGNVGDDSSASFVINAADVWAPTTNAVVAPATWTNASNVTVTLSATDIGSAVASTHYKLNGGATQAYSTPISVSAEGTTAVQYWSVDTSGNTEVAKTAYARIDRSKPTVVDDITAVMSNPAVVHLSATDGLSGVSSIQYRVDGGSWTSVPGAAATVNISGVGSHTLEYRATDAVGNQSDDTAKGLSLAPGDHTAPVTTVSGVSSSWTSATALVSLTAVDSGGAGVAATYYRFGDAGSRVTYALPFTVGAEGATPIVYWSEDNADNIEATRTVVVRIDRTMPEIETDTQSVYGGRADVRVEGIDPLSGIATMGYRLDEGSWVTTSAATIDLSCATLGDHTLTMFALDFAGNRFETIDNFSIVPAAKLIRSPSGSSFTRTRSRGVAKWTTTATFVNSQGAWLVSRPVKLQRKIGTGSWKTMYTLTTKINGKVTKTVSIRTKGTTKWRWYAPSDLATYPSVYSTTATVKVR